MPTLKDAPAADDDTFDDNWSSNKEQSGFQSTPLKNKPLVYYGLIVFLLLTAVFMGPLYSLFRYIVPSVNDQRAAENKQFVNQWLVALHNGESGGQFWSKESCVTPVKLFSVSAWEIVRYDSSCVWARVDSSNASGMPIRKLWKMQMTGFDVSPHTYAPKITAVTDADSEK
jgi:hypothetical protein